MYQDYFNAVIDCYRTKEKNAELSQRLMRSTPGRIKDECMYVCEARFEKKDLGTLGTFFKTENDQLAVLKAIRRCERDRFKPLDNFLKKETLNTDYLNIELLAWLIDFPARPFKPGVHFNTVEKPLADDRMILPVGESHYEQSAVVTGAIADAPVQLETGDVVSQKRIAKVFRPPNHWKKTFAAAVALLLLVLFSFYLLNNEIPDNLNDSGALGSMAGTSDPSESSNSFPIRNTALVYARCTGSTPCKACSNCSSCNYCNSGGSCGKCAGTKKTSTQKRVTQCKATTKKGSQCKRPAKAGSQYCWQHS